MARMVVRQSEAEQGATFSAHCAIVQFHENNGGVNKLAWWHKTSSPFPGAFGLNSGEDLRNLRSGGVQVMTRDGSGHC